MRKKLIAFLLTLMICLSFDVVKAEEYDGDIYYLPKTGSNYFVSQHTYSFYSKDNRTTLNEHRTPTLSDLRKNTLDSDLNYETFTDKYTLPWTTAELNYVVVYCADKGIPIVDEAGYRRVPIMESTYIDDNIKKSLIGILKNSYPYISKDKMINILLKEGILVEKEVDGKVIYTAKANAELEEATVSITEDELVSATQMAISTYTNPGQIAKIYQASYEGSQNTLTTKHGLHEYAYSFGYHTPVQNNINAVYNYLISQKEEEVDFKVTKIESTATAEKFIIHVATNRPLNEKDNLKVVLNNGDEKPVEYNMSELKTDENGAYIFDVTGVAKLDENARVVITGSKFEYDRVYAYEALAGKDVAQTQVGISADYSEIKLESGVAGDTVLKMEEIENPNTTDYIVVIALSGIVLAVIFTVVYHNKRKLS